MTAFVFTAADEHDTERLAAALAAELPPSSTIALCGTLGAGKTRFVRALAAACGISPDEVTSPTFVLCHQYHGTRTIYHLDAYRLKDEDEFRALGAEELFSSDGIVVIEWADRVTAALPEDYLRIDIDVTGPAARQFSLQEVGTEYEGVVRAVQASLEGTRGD